MNPARRAPPADTAAPLMASFDAWCAHQRQRGRLRRDASVTVYRAMWTALAAWCGAQPGVVALQALDAGLLARYLGSRHGTAGPDLALTPRYRLRLLSLVRRVQAHHQASLDPLAGMHPDRSAMPSWRAAAALAWSQASLSGQPALPLAPTDAPCSLPAVAVDRLRHGLLHPPADAAAGRWQALRDRCALALQLGAGIGPGDLRALTVADVLPPPPAQAPAPAPGAVDRGLPGWRLQVPANGNARAYPAPVAHWAAGLLQQWLDCRSAQALPGPWLFPSTRSGKPWGKVAQYGAARRSLASAGVADGPGGSFRLRHSFALRQLVHGHDSDTVATWLGVSDPAVMQRYRQALAAALIDHAAHGRHAAPDPAGAPASSNPASAGPQPWPV